MNPNSAPVSRKPASRKKRPSTLRKRAEAALRAGPPDIAGMSTADIEKMLHELQVHQIELKIQNEELLASQAELAQSRDRLIDLYDFAPVAYLTLDSDGIIVEANLTAATMLGVQRETLIGRKLTRFIPAAAQDRLYLHQQAILESGEKQVCELLLRRSDGTTRSVRMETVCYRDPGTHTPRSRSAIIDITQQELAGKKLAQLNATLEQLVAERTESLRESEERFRQVCDSIQQVFWMTDVTKSEMLYISPGYERIWGRTCRSLYDSPRTWLDAIHPEDRSRVADAALNKQSSGGYDLQYRIVRPDGTERWIRDRAFPIRDAKGNVHRIAGVADDITGRMRNDAALQRQARLLHLSHDAIFAWSTMGGIEYWNRGAALLYGYHSSESMGREPNEHLKTVHGTPWSQIEGELRSNGDWEGTLRRTTKGGNEVVVAARLQMIPDDQGNGMVILESDRDITDRQRLEEALLRAGEDERQRIGRELHDGLGQEIAGIALFNNVLQTSLKLKALPEASAAVRLAELLAHTSNELRRISHGLQPLLRDADGLMRGIRTMVAVASLQDGTNCVFRCGKDVAVHNYDSANHLYRIAQEAVQNALRHGKPGEVVVSLTRSEDRVILEVQDDGPGFDPKSPGSHGIGLSTMKYRAEAMRGCIDLVRPREGGMLVRCSVPDPPPAMPAHRKTARRATVGDAA